MRANIFKTAERAGKPGKEDPPEAEMQRRVTSRGDIDKWSKRAETWKGECMNYSRNAPLPECPRPECPKPSRHAPIAKWQCSNREVAMHHFWSECPSDFTIVKTC